MYTPRTITISGAVFISVTNSDLQCFDPAMNVVNGRPENKSAVRLRYSRFAGRRVIAWSELNGHESNQ
jgi:hypothetical protein